MGFVIKIATGAWNGDKYRVLNFPDNWNISVYESQWFDALDESHIRIAFAKPIGAKPIHQLAQGKKNAVIIVDDLSRPTPAYAVIPYILNDLSKGGIKEESISFVIGGGTHRPLNDEEIARKVGDSVVSKFGVYNHNVFSKNLENLGYMDDGTPMYINEIVMNSDLKIGVGGIIPHVSAGFGGGGKIIIPGVAGYDTIAYNHSKFKGRGRGILKEQGSEKDMRDNVEDAARFVGLDFMANITINSKRQITGIFAGDAIESYRQGAIFAKEIYDTFIPEEDIESSDIVIINAYPQDYDPAQMGKSVWPYDVFKNAQKIMVNTASDGINYHGLADKMDYESYLKMKNAETPTFTEREIQSKDDFILLFSNFPKADFYKRYPNGVMLENWDDLVKQLNKLYNDAKVAVIPYSPIQLPHIV